MAITDSYCTAVEYRARTTKTDSGDDATILAQLTAASRLLDRECERFFGIDASVVARLYTGNGLTRLYVDDLATLTGLVVKADLNGDYDYADSNETLTIGTHFWAGPSNSGLGSEPEPWRYLDIVPGNAVLRVWPSQLRAVEVTAKFGWHPRGGCVDNAAVARRRGGGLHVEPRKR